MAVKRDNKIGLLIDFTNFIDNPDMLDAHGDPRSFSLVEWVWNGDSRMGYEGDDAVIVDDKTLSELIMKFVDKEEEDAR